MSDTKRPGLENLMTVRIVRLAEIVARFATRRFEARFGLKNTDLRILNILDSERGVSIIEIARRTHVDRAWINRSLHDLARRGLVALQPDPRDSRKMAVDLTPTGRDLLEQVRPVALAGEQALLEGVDFEQVSALLDQLTRNADAMFDDPA